MSSPSDPGAVSECQGFHTKFHGTLGSTEVLWGCQGWYVCVGQGWGQVLWVAHLTRAMPAFTYKANCWETCLRFNMKQ